ncbi:MAG: molybdopterin biosynthesis protein MoeA [Thermovirga sp.]|nr:molybdopterin biosynthesis protein MoeA [Thermovirga sp.]
MVKKTCKEHISLKEILLLLKENIVPLNKTISLSTTDSHSVFVGKILAKDVYSERNVPHYPASAVDGYAVRACDTGYASPATPVKIEKGNFLWVNTGSVVPENFDAVVMVEDTTIDEHSLYVFNAVSKGTNVRPVGEDIAKGNIIARKGDLLSIFHKALFVAAGVKEIEVKAPPRACFVPTGNEIVDINTLKELKQLPPGKIPETNSVLLAELFQKWGYSLDVLPLTKDDPKALGDILKLAIKDYDLVLMGAGTAKGKRDHSAKVLSEQGKLVFRWVRMKPGRPVIMAVVEGKPVVALPGFPVSTLVASWSVVYPLLQLLEKGKISEEYLSEAIGTREVIKVELGDHYSARQGVSEWLKVQCAEINGRKMSWVTSSGASSMMPLTEADGFSLVNEEALEIPKGSLIDVWLVRKNNWERRAVYQGSNDPGIEHTIGFIRAKNADLIIRSVGSLGGVLALARGECHIAACHLLDPKTGEYNTSYIEKFDVKKEWERVVLYKRLQGLIVRRGNPKKIKGISDLAKEVVIVNRQAGSGTRVLLDYLLGKANIAPTDVKGYENIAVTHFDAASKVAYGSADVALGIKAVADALDLDFVPLIEEPFEIVIPKRHFEHYGVKAFLDSINEKAWKETIINLGGYRLIR